MDEQISTQKKKRNQRRRRRPRPRGKSLNSDYDIFYCALILYEFCLSLQQISWVVDKIKFLFFSLFICTYTHIHLFTHWVWWNWMIIEYEWILITDIKKKLLLEICLQLPTVSIEIKCEFNINSEIWEWTCISMLDHFRSDEYFVCQYFMKEK